MARFDPSKYQRIIKTGQSDFDPSKYQRIVKPTNAELFLKMAKGTPYEFPELTKDEQTLADLSPALGDIGRGIGSGLQNTGAFATSGLPEGLQIPRFDPEPRSSFGRAPIEAGKLLSSFIPSVGAERAVAAGLGAVKGIPQALSRIGAGAAGGAASAPSFDASPALGAAFGAAGGAIPSALSGAMGKFLGRNVTPEQFELARQAVPPHIRAPIGQLANSPNATTAFDAARAITFSGADKPMKQMFNHLTEGTENLIADAPEVGNASQFVFDDISKSYNAAKENTNNAYTALADSADAANTPFIRGSYDTAIDDSIQELDKKVKNKTTEKLYAGALDALNDFKGTTIESFGDAVSIRPALNDLIKSASKQGDRVTARHLQKIKSGLDNSIAESAAQNPELLQLHKSANDARIHQGTFENLNRRDKTPFYKIHSKDGDPDNLINSHIRTSNKGGDFSGLLGHLTEKLSPEAKSVVAKSYLNPTGETTLAKQLTKLGKLSPNQRNLMFGDKAPLAHELNELSNIFPGAKVADFTPKTGFTGHKIGQLLTHASLLAAGFATQHPGALAAAASIPAGGQAMQRFLRSNALKDAYAKYLKQQPGGAASKTSKKGLLARALALQSVGGEQNGS